MRARISVAAAAALSLWTFSAIGQEPDSRLERFHEFFEQFMDSEWSYHTRMTGPDGEVVYEGEDLRTYTFGIRKRFAIENVYQEQDDGTRTHVALSLIGVDQNTGELRLSSFWPWQPTALGEVSIEMRHGSDGVALIGKGKPAGVDYPRIAFECRFETADLYRCETETISEDGTRYRSNVETFERRAS